MAEITEIRVGGEQGDRSQAWVDNPHHRANPRWYGVVVLIAIPAIAAGAALTLSPSEESVSAVI